MARPHAAVLLWLLCAFACRPESAWSQTPAPVKPDRFKPVPPEQQQRTVAPAPPGLVEYMGARSFTPEQLREALSQQLQEIQTSGLTRPRADDTAYYLAVYYRKQGFSAVEVNWEIRGRQLILKIAEGPRTYLRNVTFAGNQAITNATLFEYMIGATRERLSKQPQQFPFVSADVESGVERVRGLYENEGYGDAVVDPPVISLTRDRTAADVTVRIKEGPRYGVGTVDFIGETLFPREELLKGLGAPLNEPYTTQRLNTMQRSLEFFYKSRGYYNAKVAASSDPTRASVSRRNPDGTGYDRLVPIRFEVTPAALYRFDGVTASGLDQLRPSFIQHRFAALHGDVYDPARLDEKFRELLQTGLFKNLRINSVTLPDNTIRLDLNVEEAKPKEFGFSLGFSTYEGLIIGLRLANRDLNGTGRPLSLDFEQSFRSLRAELLYVDQWLWETDFQLRARLYARTRDEEGYSKRETGGRADLTRKVTKNIELGVFLQLENVEITEAAIEPIYLGLTAYQIATLGFSQSYDFRDNVLSPSKGWIINHTIDVDAIAGELAFGRATARLSYYWPIGKKLLLAAGARGGLVYPLSSVPIDERYFSGGGTTVRSFRERQLGPKDKQGYPIGGEAFTVFNLELDFPIKGALHGAVFTDAGNVIGQFRDAGLDDLRFAIGAGLRYKLPIGPIRLDVGINPSPKAHEDWGAVHFSFGFAF